MDRGACRAALQGWGGEKGKQKGAIAKVWAVLVSSVYHRSSSGTSVLQPMVKLQKRWPNTRPREHDTRSVCSPLKLRCQFKPIRMSFLTPAHTSSVVC